MTTQTKGYPFEVLIAGNPASAALADHVKSMDWLARKSKRKGKATPGKMAEVRAKIHALIDG
jgi:mRNA interferase MazF